MSQPIHVAVMSREVIDGLRPRAGARLIDGTLGGASHTEELLKASGPDGRVMSFDVDPQALRRAAERLASYGDRWMGVEANFRRLADVARERDFAPCDGVLLDLGLSSDELEDPSKGLSFRLDGPLDMRLGPQANEDGLTAAEIVNGWNREDLERIFREYGEERFAGRIADAIVKARKAARFIGTLDLVAVIRSAVPAGYEHGRIHPATRTFQALRIAVNDELGALRDAIDGARDILAPGGRLAIITFHSLEDRIVKHAFRDAEDLNVLTKHPLVPTEEETEHNPRARSAKLRLAEKINSTGEHSGQTKTTKSKTNVCPEPLPLL